MGKLVAMLKDGVRGFWADECFQSGAALAYYAVFALPALIVVVFYVASWFHVSDQQVGEILSRQVGLPIPSEGQSSESLDDGNSADESRDTADAAGSPLTAVAERQRTAMRPMEGLGSLSRVIGIGILVLSATGVFAQLQHALNKAWAVQPDSRKSGWRRLIVKRVLSLGMIIVVALLLLISLVITTFLNDFVHWMAGASPGRLQTMLSFGVDTAVTLLLATLVFALMYKLLPDADIRLRDMWAGALLTAILFVIGKAAIGWYLNHSAIGSAWGTAAASLLALLVWMYYTSLVVLFGAELTQAWAARFGEQIAPEEGAARTGD